MEAAEPNEADRRFGKRLAQVTVAPKNGAIMAGRKGPAMWLRYGQAPAQWGQM